MCTLRGDARRSDPLLGVIRLYRTQGRLRGREDARRSHGHCGQRGAVLVVVGTQRRREEGVEPRAQSRRRIASSTHGEGHIGDRWVGFSRDFLSVSRRLKKEKKKDEARPVAGTNIELGWILSQTGDDGFFCSQKPAAPCPRSIDRFPRGDEFPSVPFATRTFRSENEWQQRGVRWIRSEPWQEIHQDPAPTPARGQRSGR